MKNKPSEMRNSAPEGVKSKKILSYTAGGWYVLA